MHLNAFVFVAQLVNFLLLMLLLKHLLYARVLAAMDARTAEIAAQQAQTAALQAQAAAARADSERQQQQAAGERAALLDRARAEADRARQEMLTQAREAASASRRAWQDALRQEQTDFVRAFRRAAAQQLCAAARRALADLADAELEQCMAAAFFARLPQLDAAARRELAATPAATPVIMRSAFPFPDALRADCARAWHGLLGREPVIRYETVADLVGGIEARLAGHTLAWNINDYLGQLSAELDLAFRDKAGAA